MNYERFWSEGLTARQARVLEDLCEWCTDNPGRFARPMDVGGRDGSHHSRVLGQLVRRRLVERQPRATLVNELMGYGRDSAKARSWLYRINDPGRRALVEIRTERLR